MRSHGLHSSSAALADRHLASVLTNPLLTKRDGVKSPVLDFTSAKIDLQKNPAQDPILLLEEYHEKGAATIPIAVLCLETFRNSVDNLPPEKRQQEIVKTEAGKRTLLWLWRGKFHETDAFVDDKRLMKLMVPIVIQEGHEDFLWDWLKLDMTLGSQDQAIKLEGYNRKHAYYYRWKGCILREIVTAKLDEVQYKSADAALEAFFKACDLRIELLGNRVDPRLPLGPAAMFLETAFTRPGKQPSPVADSKRYDRFIEAVPLYVTDKTWQDFQKGLLRLFHPHSATPLPFLEVLKDIFSSEDLEEKKVRGMFESPRSEKQALYFYNALVETIVKLQEGLYTEDADWVLSQTHRLYPRLVRFIDGDLRKRRGTAQTPATGDERDHAVHTPVPFPSFV